MIITIMGGLAQEESVSISNNLRWSIKNRMKNGTMKMCTPVYGYYLINGELVINESEACIVKQLFEWYLNGIGTSAIAEKLNNMKINKFGRECHWTPKTVKTILTNEKYIGDQLFQKKYTTMTLPFKQMVNKGEYEQYYYTDRQEAIVSKEIFEKVKKLLEERQKYYHSNRYNNIFSKKIYCAVCGSTFKLKVDNEKHYWVCRKHDESAKLCESIRIAEFQIYNTFITLYNKLKSQCDVIFPPLITQLQELKNKKFGGNQKYMDIAKEIANLKEQMHVFARLKTKGFLDEAKYIEQSNELTVKIEKLNRAQRKIVHSDGEDEIIDQIKEIAVIIENGIDLMTEFDEIMFESLVEKIIVKDQTTLEFYLYGGLKFKEELR